MLVSWPPRLFCPFSTSMSSSSSSLPALRFRPLHVTMERRERSSVVISSANSLGDPLASPNHDQTHELSSSTGVVPLTPPISIKLWNLPDHHLLLLSTVACMTGVAVSALFLSAIPTLLAFKRAAESLEKLLDVTREELPGTMAAVRLSGMEISDLTMELSKIGQEISSGVKSSTRVVRAAQDGLRHVSSIATAALLQDQVISAPRRLMKPTVSVARGLRESLTSMRTMFRRIVTLRYVMSWIGKLWSMRGRLLLRGH